MQIIENIGLIGLTLWVIAMLNRKSKWSKPIEKIGVALMILDIALKTGFGLYDGYVGNPKRF